MNQEYKYYAFISYNHRDEGIVRWLHKKLEGFKLPSEKFNEIDARQRYIRPVFRDKDDLNAGVLVDELRDKLCASKFLIVVCSRNSCQSEWVNREVSTFIDLGRIDHIIPFVLDDDLSVLPQSLKDYTSAHPEQELLGINIREVGREKAFVRIVSKMLGVSFDSLWNRHTRQRRRRRFLLATVAAAVCMLLVGTWQFNRPKSVCLSLSSYDGSLPDLPSITDIIVQMQLPNEVKTDTLDSFGGAVVFANIPAKYIGKEVALSITAPHCCPLDTVVSLLTDINLLIRRDPKAYGHIAMTLFSVGKNAPVSNADLTIAGYEVFTDERGHFSIDVPIDRQSASYRVTSHRVSFHEGDDIIYPLSLTETSILICE